MKKEEVVKLFDQIYFNYDRANTLLSLGIDRYWRHKMVSNIDKGSFRVLDACCGTGSSSYSIYKASGQEATVYGIDFSKKMLEVAKKRYNHYSPHLKFIFSDAASTNFEDNFFDTVAIAYGIRNITEREKALTEFYRVTKHGGRLICLEFGYPRCRLVKWVYSFYLNLVLVNIGGLLGRNRPAYAYLVKSIKEFPAVTRFKEMIKSTGYHRVEVTALTFGICNIYVAYKD
ncbi:MAG: bifunctional demethylmenaquinone methyltransferase/2-methoxy-6-polyprenyl-1,4-benzoquinol methylase UbiE [Actinomycetia bacterium]|nr:bifunctional demethylmenaquinone methyltransferase/2-methoxy-6-polyprenyl-1,4-benzoquinol methylase UbiE [Actinomycetes bacterium]